MVCTVVGNEIHRRSDLTMLPAIFVFLLVSVVFGGNPPEITMKPKSQQVRSGGTVAFYCAARGDPNPSLFWRKNGKRVSENHSRYQMTNFTSLGISLLRIDSVRSGRDNATYECIAESGVGDAVSAEATLVVYEEKKLPPGFPVITSPPASKAVEVGHNAVLHCTVTGDPPPTIMWIRDFLPLDINSNERYSILDSGLPGALQITNSMESDQGKYECVAENSVGTEYSQSVNLFIKVRKVAPQFSIAPPSFMEVKMGDDFNITCVAIGSPMPYVKWQREPKIDITPEDQLPVGKNVLEIKNAQTSENYTCTAASALGTVNATTYVKVQSLPGPPTDVVINEVTATSVRLSWTHPAPADSQYYVIQYKPRMANQAYTEISGIISLYYTVRNLSPYTEYEFYVIAVNNLGRGPPSNAVTVITGETARGTTPRNVQVRPLSSSTMVIQWDEPESQNGQVTAYKVYYTTNPDLPMSSWNSRFIDTNSLTTIGDLTPLTIYTIRVQAFTSVGPGPLSAPVQIKTQQGVPSQPRDLRATEIGETSITLEWNTPSHSGENIVGYDLMWNDTYSKEKGHRRIPDTNKYTLEELYPNTLYYIWLLARSQRGEGATTSPIPVRTKQYVPGAPPQNVTGEAVGPTSIFLQWEPPPPNRTNGQITYYKVFKVEANRSDSEADVTTVTNGTFIRLDELNRWTDYRLWVLAGTAVGDGPASQPITVRTHEDVPGPPTNVKATPVNSTTIHVEWKPPEEHERNGIIRQYHIHVQETKHETGAPLLNEPLRYDVQGVLEYNVTDLQPDTYYQIQVAALTRRGDGARSPQITVKTPGGVPNRPTINLKTTNRDQDITLDVEWTKPQQTYGELKGYKLRYGIKDQQLIEQIMKPTVNQFRLHNLERGIEYEFRVSGQNQIGFGQEAISYFETPEGPPTGPPTNVTHYFQTPDVVCIQWNYPIRKERNGKIIRYDIQFSKKIDSAQITHRNTTQNRTVFSGLEEGTEYVYTVRAATKQGPGPWSEKFSFATNKDMVRAPMGLKAMATSDQSVEVWWESIPSVRHKLYGYQLFYTMMAVEDLDAWQKKSIGLTESAELVSLEKNAQYAIAVAANTSAGLGRLSEKITVKVKPEDVPMDLRAKDVTTHTMTLTWSRPIKLNPISYQVSYDAFKEFVDSVGVTQIQPVPRQMHTLPPTTESFHLKDLSPFTTYNINVTAKPANGEYRPPTRITVTTQMAAPRPMVRPDFYGVINEEEITVMLPQASEEYGPISHYYLVVVPENLETKQMTSPDQFLTNDLLNWTKEGLEGKPYIAGRFPQRSIPYTYQLGTGETFNEFTNRKLERGSVYRIFVRAVVDTQKNLYTSSPFSIPLSLEMRSAPPGDIPKRSDTKNPIESDAAEVSKINKAMQQSMLWYIGPIVAAALVCFFLLLFFFIKRRRHPVKYREPGAVTRPLMSEEVITSHAPSDPVEMRRLMYQTPAMVSHPPIPVSMLAQHIEMLKANDNLKFSQEYESIEPGQQFTWDHSSMDINKRKNRYANVIAYDHSRVVLQDTEGVPGGDYINANYCDGYRKHNAYIATQGPLIETFADFWKMCWEVKTATIVMMTKLEERTRIKCDQYWPSRGTETFGSITVTLSDVQELATYCIRTFHINKGMDSERREIKQLQFTAWPDHGVPDHPAPFLQFLRRVKNVNPPDAGPLIVHCSAGVGRTGCFIVIDAMIERLKFEKTVDIYGHVTCLRAQRNYMVQTEDQYIFIHDAVLEHVICGVTEVSARNLHAHIQNLMQIPEGETVTGLALEFKKLSNMKVDSNRFVSASLPCNKHKNRLVHILPIESTRVCLTPIRGVEGSDYINASLIDGYRQRGAYIATQGPLQDTTDDFWRMLWEHNSTIVVMLTKLKEMGREKCYQYWPSERSVRYQCLVVEPIAEYNMPLYVLREFKITDARDGSSRTLRQFQFNDWPEQGIPKTGDGFIDFIGQVHKTKEQFGQEGPITVHCSAGVGRTGVFITLSIVLERMQYEGVIDLFQTVRILRTQRPAMVQTEEQYQFCYQSALEYLGSFDHYTN